MLARTRVTKLYVSDQLTSVVKKGDGPDGRLWLRARRRPREVLARLQDLELVDGRPGAAPTRHRPLVVRRTDVLKPADGLAGGPTRDSTRTRRTPWRTVGVTITASSTRHRASARVSRGGTRGDLHSSCTWTTRTVDRCLVASAVVKSTAACADSLWSIASNKESPMTTPPPSLEFEDIGSGRNSAVRIVLSGCSGRAISRPRCRPAACRPGAGGEAACPLRHPRPACWRHGRDEWALQRPRRLDRSDLRRGRTPTPVRGPLASASPSAHRPPCPLAPMSGRPRPLPSRITWSQADQ